MCICFIKRYVKPGCYKKVEIIGTKWPNEKRLSVRLVIDSAGFLDSLDMVHTFNIRKFFTQNKYFNNLFALNK